MTNPKVTTVYQKTRSSKKPIIINVGGARSSKSYSIIQLFLEKFVEEENKEFLITRKTLPSLKRSAYKVFLQLAKVYGVYDFFYHNKAESRFEFKNNYLSFCGVDEAEKIKSTEFNYIFCEEANEFTWEDFNILNLRLSGPTTLDEPNHLYIACNPNEIYGWVKTKLIDKDRDDIEVIRSTYLDNPFLDEKYIKKLLDLKEQDLSFYQIYTLGEFAELKGKIYENWDIYEDDNISFNTIIGGVDFGTAQECGVVIMGVNDKEPNDYYIFGEIKEKGLTHKIFKERIRDLLKELGVNEFIPLYCDTEDAAGIKELADWPNPLNVLDAKKGAGSVRAGIEFVRCQKLHVHTRCLEVKKELQSYKRKIDSAGNILEVPVKWNDHLVDAIRYAIWTYAGVELSEPFVLRVGQITTDTAEEWRKEEEKNKQAWLQGKM